MKLGAPSKNVEDQRGGQSAWSKAKAFGKQVADATIEVPVMVAKDAREVFYKSDPNEVYDAVEKEYSQKLAQFATKPLPKRASAKPQHTNRTVKGR